MNGIKLVVGRRPESMHRHAIQIRNELSLSVYVAAASEQQAMHLPAGIGAALPESVAITAHRCSRYRKMPEWFELALELKSVDAESAFMDIAGAMQQAMITGTEESDGDWEAIWNADSMRGRGHFLHPAVRWAQLLLSRRVYLSMPSCFSVGDRVRLIRLLEAEDMANPEIQALIGRTAVVKRVEPRREGCYHYGIEFEGDPAEACVSSCEPFGWHWESELAAA
ncbi:hypothetical protein FE236_00365 [Mariprofundus erugo]|uniref:hypothetical protein n=1 Tax=Mariprofundus erugo TaxID=2528639 RepID=UPI0010FE3D33|nr:hypothetical protein [Mariprofundus erugo]TLS78247.1 hypothetical protein FE236_00365 [Mariprofundus erugo]